MDIVKREEKFFSNTCIVDYCALTGAVAFFLGIKNAIAVINGARFCYFQMLHHLERCFGKGIAERVYCTDLKNDNIIFGSQEVLTELLFRIKREKKPSVLFIQNNCAASLIGDDIHEIAYSLGFSCPVVTLDGGGIQGGFYQGYEMAAQNFWNEIKLPDPSRNSGQGVNILGATPGYYNFFYDQKEIEYLLSLADIPIVSRLMYDFDMSEISRMKDAALNVVIHQELGESMAKFLYEQYHIPYIVLPPPYGFIGSAEWLEKILAALGRTKTSAKKAFVAIEECRSECAGTIKNLSKKFGDIWIPQIHIAGAFSVAFPLAEALRREFVNYRDMYLYIYHDCDTSMINDEYYKLCHGFSPDIAEAGDGFLFGSFNERRQLMDKGFGYICISYPNNDCAMFGPLMGIAGSKRILERLWQYFFDRSVGRVLGKGRA